MVERRSCLKCIFSVIIAGILIYVGRNVWYLLSVFVIQVNKQTNESCRLAPEVNTSVPDLIHHIYYPIKSPELSDGHRAKMQSWTSFNPKFKHILWNESAVVSLIRKDHPKLLSLYYSYGHWVQRIDVAKYVILYHYGGWYIDLDITCRKSLQGLIEEMYKTNKSVVLHSEDTVGPATDFFGVTPHNPFIKFVLNSLPSANKWFLFQHTTIMFSTGPSFLWGRYLNYGCQGNILVLSLKRFSQYARLSHDCSWWGQDTRAIYYILDHKLSTLAYFVVFSIIFITVFKTRVRIFNFMKKMFLPFYRRSRVKH